MKAASLALLLALAAGPAAALQRPDVVGLHLASVHASNGRQEMGARGWNEANVGVYARWRNGFTAGAFRNSEYRTSAYAGWTFSDAHDRFALTAGLVTGYSRGEIMPLLVPSVRLPLTQHTSARLAFVAGDKRAAAVHLMIERRF